MSILLSFIPFIIIKYPLNPKDIDLQPYGGEIIKEDDIYSFEFMEDCYRKGKEDARLNSHFGTDDHHIYDQIQKVLVQVIKIVMNYEDKEDAKC